ncbi:selenium cofactor biosynthesis protein YqeC [Halalkaliarchaeum desulfuricum]|nr:selenium cofactor biosynthesis protein YqeC [Halalkaliarchaeum desulfuricum]
MNLSDALELGDRELVSFVGAGGKKTAMGKLAREADSRGLVPGYTTTTHMPPPPEIPLVCVPPETVSSAVSGRTAPIAVASEWVFDPDRADKKVRGFDPESIDDLYDSNALDWVLVKADGARRREFKAPGPGEPVIPTRSTVVVVVASVTAAGRPNDTGCVHRPERVAEIAGIERGDPLSPESMAAVLASERGGAKDIPERARAVLLVNKADTTEQRHLARSLVRETFRRTDAFSAGFVSSFVEDWLEPVPEN